MNYDSFSYKQLMHLYENAKSTKVKSKAIAAMKRREMKMVKVK